MLIVFSFFMIFVEILDVVEEVDQHIVSLFVELFIAFVVLEVDDLENKVFEKLINNGKS
jgi:hypothetical protein